METIFAIGMPGGPEWIFILLAILLLFGAKRIPDLARGLGKGIREFKDATKEIKKEKPLNMPVNELLIEMVKERLKGIPEPSNNQIGNAVREVIDQDLIKTIPWWADFLKAAKIDNSEAYNTNATFVSDAITYIKLYYETLDKRKK